MSAPIVGQFTRETKYSIFSSKPEEFWETHVSFSGISMRFSRYDNESNWACDAAMKISNSYPLWEHGPGDRSCAKKSASGELADVINAAFLRQASNALQEEGKATK